MHVKYGLVARNTPTCSVNGRSAEAQTMARVAISALEGQNVTRSDDIPCAREREKELKKTKEVINRNYEPAYSFRDVRKDSTIVLEIKILERERERERGGERERKRIA